MKCISISFKTAPELIRNKFAFEESEKANFINKLNKLSPGTQCVILTTCNRTEIYTESANDIFPKLENLLSQKSGLKIHEIRKYARYYENQMAIEHLFKVTCGLDSMIIGENEILSQVKSTYLQASKQNKTGYELNTAFMSALSCSKKIRTQTEISKSALSYATLCCNEIKKYIETNNLVSPSIMIIGASGKIGSAIAKNLLNKKTSIKIYATKRVHKINSDIINATEIIDYSSRFEYLKKVDIVVSATNSPHYTINYSDTIKNIYNKPKLFIDLAMPYDIDREIENIPKCKLITIDFFKNIIKANNLKKSKSIDTAQDIIQQELQKVYKNMIYHNAYKVIQSKNKNLREFSLEKFIYYLKDRLDANSFAKVINVIEKEESFIN